MFRELRALRSRVYARVVDAFRRDSNNAVIVKEADLDHWERHPNNLTGAEILAEALRLGWTRARTSGDHVILYLDGFDKVLVIDLGTRAAPTKRAMIRILKEGKRR